MKKLIGVLLVFVVVIILLVWRMQCLNYIGQNMKKFDELITKKEFQKANSVALKIVKRIGVKRLENWFGKQSIEGRLVIIQAVGESGKKRFCKWLLCGLEQFKTLEEKITAVEALGNLKCQRAVDRLEKIYRSSNIWGMRVMAAEALRKITGREYKVEFPEE